jgi:hypothetical protein
MDFVKTLFEFTKAFRKKNTTIKRKNKKIGQLNIHITLLKQD